VLGKGGVVKTNFRRLSA